MRKNELIKILFLGVFTMCVFNTKNAYALELNKNIKSVHAYSEGTQYYCITGNESNCRGLIQDEWKNAYDVGTPIEYDLGMDSQGNNIGLAHFNVISDDNEYIEMLSQNTYQDAEYVHKDSAVGYTFGQHLTNTLNFNQVYNNIACDSTNTCYQRYSEKVTSNLRFLTFKEAIDLGCNENEDSCKAFLKISNDKGYWLAGKYIDGITNYDAPIIMGRKIMHQAAFNEGATYRASLRPIIRIKKFEDEISTNDADSNNKTDTKSGQTVKVEDTFKTAYIGYCIGSIILILGIAVMYQTYRKSKAEINE